MWVLPTHPSIRNRCDFGYKVGIHTYTINEHGLTRTDVGVGFGDDAANKTSKSCSRHPCAIYVRFPPSGTVVCSILLFLRDKILYMLLTHFYFSLPTAFVPMSIARVFCTRTRRPPIGGSSNFTSGAQSPPHLFGAKPMKRNVTLSRVFGEKCRMHQWFFYELTPLFCGFGNLKSI